MKLIVLGNKIHLILIDIPKRFLNQVELVKIICAWVHGSSIYQLSKQTPNRPNINRLTILSPNQQLGSPVPSRRNIICHLLLPFQFTSKAEITHFYIKLICLVDKNILRFDISMNNIQRVHISYSFKKLVDNLFD